jgi:predicted dehydrogenase
MTLRAGIIGCGSISQSHLEAFREQPDVEIIACTDVVRDAARKQAEQFSIPHVCDDAGALLDRDDVDLVSICVPPKWHAELLVEALARRKHVLMEKPLAMDLAEADRMVDAAARSDRIVGVALVHRYLPVYPVLRDLLGGGAIGTIRRVRLSLGRAMYGDSRFTRPDEDPRSWLVDRRIAGGGMLPSSTIHFLSAIGFALDNPAATRLTARVSELHPKAYSGIEDDVELWIELNGETDLVMSESWVYDRPFRAELLGECGQLVASGESWLDIGLEGTCGGRVPDAYRPLMDGDRLHAEPAQLGTVPDPYFGPLTTDLLKSIAAGSPVGRLPQLLHARNMHAVIAAAYASEKSGGPETVAWREEIEK